MQPDPTPEELMAAVARFLSKELMPTLTDRGMAFRVRIAAHLCGSIAGELGVSEELEAAELAGLAGLLGRSGSIVELREALATRLRSDDALPDERAIRAHLLETLGDRARARNPRFDTRIESEPS